MICLLSIKNSLKQSLRQLEFFVKRPCLLQKSKNLYRWDATNNVIFNKLDWFTYEKLANFLS
jgi:hypothetical protein